MSNYVELKERIAQLERERHRLEKEAGQLLKNEKLNVIAELRNRMNAYGITIDELQSAKVKTAPKRTRGILPPKFADGQGNTWSGKGPKPQWILNALACGKSMEDYRIQ